MGAGQSTATQTPPRALHVLRVTPSSPASDTTIEPYFDFVVGYKGDTLTDTNTIDASELERLVESHEGRTLNLLVWNSKSQDTRVVPIVPARDWSSPHASIPDPQEPEAERKPSLLGLSMRMCEPEFALDNVWHVLDVLEGSPAESAGLVPYGDWIIGWSGGVLSAEGDFYDMVEAHIEKPLRVYVYSYDFDTIREVVMIPNRHWGGEGLLGCVFGFGLLHRIPPLPADREPGAIPPELVLDGASDEYEDQQLFVPADLPGSGETTEETEERLQWEQEEWERVQGYGESYVHDHDPAYQTSSAYSGRAGVQRELYYQRPRGYHHQQADQDSESLEQTEVSQPGSVLGYEAESSAAVDDEAPVSDEGQYVDNNHHPDEHQGHDPPLLVQPRPLPVAALGVPRTPTPVRQPPLGHRASSGSIGLTSPVRGSTPTPTRPFGAYVNAPMGSMNMGVGVGRNVSMNMNMNGESALRF
ncbi:GRASP55/65 PDZ-like domain-containing protein [Epithele typhae]|uniref:GRASP55/65 PDZ-like domain-containing protein n=1 Tax=Epithele typhae TaxID=378194 RepID=UPI0020075003|nr:GRASP55/65 PDZ-like domain-containing protein [Epithele typhae]KAH9925416.1 GRASP55/65 PDZ-like domain-containing protein [Epithele typhae]